MRILFLSRYQNTINRGAEVFVEELSSRLRQKHKVDVFFGSDADSIGKILSGNYDVVIPINGGSQSLKVSIGRLFKRYQVIISGQAGIGRGEIWNMVIAQPDVYVALTDYMVKWAKKWAWRTKVVKIPNGVDLSKFKPEEEKLDLNLERPIILSVGALTWYKHHERIIEAMCYLDKGSLLIVGDGEEKNKLEEKGRENLGKRFRIQNFPYQDMPKVYRSCDLFTLPSWGREAFGIAYLEALASGLGVVAPDDQTRREIIGDAGIFVDTTDPINYAKVIEEALTIDWTKKAKAQAEKFSWDEITKDYEKIIKK